MRHVATGSLVGLLMATLVSACAEPGPTVEEAQAFVDDAEARLVELWIDAERAAWVQSNFITDDTTAIAAAAQTAVIGATMELANEAARFDEVELPEETRRKLLLLKTSMGLAAPADAALQAELAGITTSMEGAYGKGVYCPGDGEDCLDLPQMERMFAESRDTDELLDLWTGWRTISPPMRSQYARFAELANAGARDLGFTDLGELWRAGYDMPPDDFTVELERLWNQVRPLYESLHCHVRAKLADEYGSAVVPPDEPIPAHLLGNMWSQSWTNIYDVVGPGRSDPGYDLTRLLQSNRVDELQMVRYGERFFSSLGFDPLPATFWERSLFIQPVDRDVVCHASAWDLDYESDVRSRCVSGSTTRTSSPFTTSSGTTTTSARISTSHRCIARAPTTGSMRESAIPSRSRSHPSIWPRSVCSAACHRWIGTWGCCCGWRSTRSRSCRSG